MPLQLAYFASQVLLFLITTPTYILLLASKTNVSPTADLVFSRALGAVVFLAYYADGQQWSEQYQIPYPVIKYKVRLMA